MAGEARDRDIAAASRSTSISSKYSNDTLSTDDVVSIMVGDLQRVKLYAEKGFQIPQDIPADVWDAYEALVAAGYDTRLVRG